MPRPDSSKNILKKVLTYYGDMVLYRSEEKNMKRIIKIKDANGKTTQGEMSIRNTLHFDIQRNTHSFVFKNKKAYTRKEKHKVCY